MNVAQFSATISSRYRQLRWRLTVSYALVALATVLVVEWWGLVGTALFLSGALTLPEVFILVVQIAWEVVLPTALVLVVPTALVGALIGQIMVRWLDGRLERLGKVTRAWQAGDFTQRVNDSSGDEITELAGRLNEMAAQFQTLLETRQKLAGLEERNRLARELHDSVKQEGLSAIMQLGAARARLASDPQAAAGHLKEADDLIHQMQQELTGLIWELRPVGLDGRSLKVALKLAVENWSRQTHIAASLNETGQSDLPLESEEILYRIVQEALSNVARHSRAAQVEIELNVAPDQVTLVIRDDGVGFDPSEVGQIELGLRSMRERAAAVGGSLVISSTPGKGTLITTRLPGFSQ
jgi:NarL family two-component system sensor histidine kinase LiaS